MGTNVSTSPIWEFLDASLETSSLNLVVHILSPPDFSTSTSSCFSFNSRTSSSSAPCCSCSIKDGELRHKRITFPCFFEEESLPETMSVTDSRKAKDRFTKRKQQAF